MNDAPARAGSAPTAEPPRRVQPQAVHRWLLRQAVLGETPWLHTEVARRMDERLGLIRRQPDRVIDWWSTPGGGADRLRQRYPQARIEVVEPPLSAVRRPDVPRGWWQRWRTPATPEPHRDHAPHWAWPGPAPTLDAPPGPVAAGLLWSNMMLHWADHPAPVLAQWFSALAEEGLLMFSCFGPHTLRELQALYAAAGWGPSGIEFMDMHDLGDALVRAGFADPVMDMDVLTLTWDHPQAALAELRGLGGNAHPQRRAGLCTPRWRDDLLARMERDLRGPDGRLHLRFEIVYGHAVRGPERVPVAAQTHIPVDTLRRMARRGDAPR